jgi:hypothetical protein
MPLHRRAARRRVVRRAPSHRRAATVLALAALLAFGAASCRVTNPASEITLGQTVVDLTEAVNALRFETGVMQDQIDSLRVVVTRQDSAIARLSRQAP